VEPRSGRRRRASGGGRVRSQGVGQATGAAVRIFGSSLVVASGVGTKARPSFFVLFFLAGLALHGFALTSSSHASRNEGSRTCEASQIQASFKI